jgi:hypothetical protein
MQGQIAEEWKRLTKLTDQMQKFWPEDLEYPLEINCVSGGIQKVFTIPRATLRQITESELARMFSDQMLPNLAVDAEGRILLDFNPECFSLVVEYLQNRRLKKDCPIPHIPREHVINMEVLAERLKLTPFLKLNEISPVHTTSLHVLGNVVTSAHPGWQVISAKHPFSMTGVSYFETKIIKNPDTKGALAVGICNRIPSGDEVHSIRLVGSVLLVSGAGLKGDMVQDEHMGQIPQVPLAPGNVLGISHDASTNNVVWFLDGRPLGTTPLRKDRIGLMRTLYPVFAMYIPEQKIKVEFDLLPPAGLAALTAG